MSIRHQPSTIRTSPDEAKEYAYNCAVTELTQVRRIIKSLQADVHPIKAKLDVLEASICNVDSEFNSCLKRTQRQEPSPWRREYDECEEVGTIANTSPPTL